MIRCLWQPWINCGVLVDFLTWTICFSSFHSSINTLTFGFFETHIVVRFSRPCPDEPKHSRTMTSPPPGFTSLGTFSQQIFVEVSTAVMFFLESSIFLLVVLPWTLLMHRVLHRDKSESDNMTQCERGLYVLRSSPGFLCDLGYYCFCCAVILQIMLHPVKHSHSSSSSATMWLLHKSVTLMVACWCLITFLLSFYLYSTASQQKLSQDT